jgi:hypothetical protein
MPQPRHSTASLILVLVLAACAPATAPRQSDTSPAPPEAQPSIQRTLVMLNRGEPPTIAAKPLQAMSGSIAAPIHLFNAMLDYKDENEAVHPYLAEALPELNTSTWQVFPDGTMRSVRGGGGAPPRKSLGGQQSRRLDES